MAHLTLVSSQQVAIIEANAIQIARLGPLVQAAEQTRADARSAVESHATTHVNYTDHPIEDLTTGSAETE